MPLDNTFELPDITKEDELSDFIFVVQMLVEQYVRDVLGIYNDGDFLDKIRVFYRLYGNKKTMLYLS